MRKEDAGAFYHFTQTIDVGSQKRFTNAHPFDR